MDNPAGRDHPRLNIVETAVNEPAPGDEHPRPHLQIALYPQRLDRTAPPMSLSPSQAVRYAEDPDRADEAARTSGSRQVVEVSLAALWNESGATAEAVSPAADPSAGAASIAPEPASWAPEPETEAQHLAPGPAPTSWSPEPEAAPRPPAGARSTEPWYAAAAAAGGIRRSPWWRRLLGRG